MASESACPDDYMDIDATDLPLRTSPPTTCEPHETGVGTNVDDTAAPLVQDSPQHGVTTQSSRRLEGQEAGRPDHERIIMTSESACPDDYMDIDATGSPPRPSPPTTRQPHETGVSANVDDSAAVPPVQEPSQGVTPASTIRAIDDDDPPIPLLHVVDPGKESEGNVSAGPQLHDGPPGGPPCFPDEFDDSLAKGVQIYSKGPQQHDDPSGPPRFPHEYDDSLAKRVDGLERHSSDHADPPGPPPPCFPNEFDNPPDNASTVRASVADTAAVGGPMMVEDAGEGRASSRGTSQTMHTESGAAASAAGLSSSSTRRSTFIVEAYRVDETEEPPGRSTVYEAELAAPDIVLRFYQRKGFVSVAIAVALLAVGIAATTVVLLSRNPDENTETSSVVSDLRSPVPTPKGPTSSPTNNPTSLPTNQSTLPPTSSPTNNPTNLPLNSSLKLLAPDGGTPDGGSDFFGFSTSIYGDTIVVSDPCDYDSILCSGSAHAFVWNGDEWSYQAKLLDPDGTADDLFGESVAIYQNTIVVGAPEDDDNGEDSGSAHAFVRSGNVWTHQAKLLAPGGEAYDAFGYSVAIYEDTIVVGASGDGDMNNGYDSGSAHVFVRSREEWEHQAKLMAPDIAADDYFGEIVDIHEDTIVVGAYGDSDNGEDSGSAHVFVRRGNEWTHQAKLLAPDGAGGDYFGGGVAIYEDTIVVGAPNDDDNSGSAHVFVRSGEEWTHQAKLLSPERAAENLFGYMFAIYEDTIVVRDDLVDFSGNFSGTAQVFVRSEVEWTHQVKLLAPDALNFGVSVAIYGDTIVAGTYGVDNGDYSGSAHIFLV